MELQVSNLSMSFSPASSGSFQQIPFELIWEISTYLSNVSKRALSLTCRPYYYGFRGKLPEPSFEDTDGILQLLERDNPKRYLCHKCMQLHERPDLKESHDGQALRSCFDAFDNLNPFDCSRDLPFVKARLVMNRHFYGEMHGLPLSSLDKPPATVKHACGSITQCSQKARIVSGELFILWTYKMWNEAGDEHALRRCMEENGLYVCCHLAATSKYRNSPIPQLRVPYVGTRAFSSHDGQGSCATCATDYTASTVFRGEDEGWVIKVRSFQRYGACRSPFDWAWRHMAEYSILNEPRGLWDVAGTVKDGWVSSKELTGSLPLSGAFVGFASTPEGYILGSRRCPWKSYDCWNSRGGECVTHM